MAMRSEPIVSIAVWPLRNRRAVEKTAFLAEAPKSLRAEGGVPQDLRALPANPTHGAGPGIEPRSAPMISLAAKRDSANEPATLLAEMKHFVRFGPADEVA